MENVMNPTDALVAELEMESVATRRILESVPENKYDWRPNEKGMSMAELCGHIASIPAGMSGVLGGESFDVTEITGPDAAPANQAELLKQFDEAIQTGKSWLAGLGSAAMETWKFTNDGAVLMEMPRIVAVRSFMLNHTYHHRGQLSAYLRAAGEAVPSVYGPTADVNPFG